MSKGHGRMVAGRGYVPSLVDDYVQQGEHDGVPEVSPVVKDAVLVATMRGLADASRKAATGVARAFEAMREAVRGASTAELAGERTAELIGEVEHHAVRPRPNTEQAQTAEDPWGVQSISRVTRDHVDDGIEEIEFSKEHGGSMPELDPPTESVEVSSGGWLVDLTDHDHSDVCSACAAMNAGNEYEKMTRDELRKLAGKRGISGYRAMTKAQLVDALS